ncbi:LysR family transcriptional regulator [Phaeovulum vinaykumarii]|nr:LysR family transcriptional regulator [Phaeovulum vinaykumarii]
MTTPKSSNGTWRKQRYQRIEGSDLEVLVLAAEAGSFRRVSTQVGVGLPAITRRIQKLEDTVGVSFFERSPTGVRLTNAGWRFLCRVRRILGELKLAVADVEIAGIGGNGEINFGVTGSLTNRPFCDLVSDFLGSHREVRSNFVQADRGELETLLNHRMIDLMFAPVGHSSGNGEVLPFAKHQIFLVVSPKHDLAGRKSVSWSDIATVDLILGAQEPELVFETFTRSGFIDRGDRIKVKRHALDREGIFNLVDMNLGSLAITAA